MRTTRYATLCYPGSFFPETTDIRIKKAPSRELARELFNRFGRDGCYRIEFRSRTETVAKGQRLVGEWRPEKVSYLLGEPFTLAEMKAMRPALDAILISNVECNRWKGAVRCKPGNWQPWGGDVEVLTP